MTSGIVSVKSSSINSVLHGIVTSKQINTDSSNGILEAKKFILEPINIWVDGGDLNDPFYNFYSDSSGTNQIVLESFLDKTKTYKFQRLASATSHPFYISDQGYSSTSNTIILEGNGTHDNGITGAESFTVNLNGAGSIVYYCTTHFAMNKSVIL